jgi:predicted nuclease with TOPRIM domain
MKELLDEIAKRYEAAIKTIESQKEMMATLSSERQAADERAKRSEYENTELKNKLNKLKSVFEGVKQ